MRYFLSLKKPLLSRSKIRTIRLLVERLEDRSVPAIFTVSNLNDAGTGSLRQAILDADAVADADTIIFTGAAVGGTINLMTIDGFQYGPNAMEINSPITIQGSGETIQRGVGASNFRLFYVSLVGNLTLQNVTLSNGLARGGDGSAGGGGGLGAGGAIYNQGTLSILNSLLVGNTAQGGNGGAGATGGGGGGMGGNGGNANGTNGNGGGGGTASNGFDGINGVGGNGGATNGGLGGTPGAPGSGASGSNGSGGGNGGGGGGGGINGFSSDGQHGGNGGGGGNGGSGGGGGGGAATPSFEEVFPGAGGFGGDGGFGGGGGGGGYGGQSVGVGIPDGAEGNGGNAGFGGGGGGGKIGGVGGTAGYGGAGGSGIGSGGGGGAGVGGALFNDVGSVTLANTTLSGNSAIGGFGGSRAGNGVGAGGAVFTRSGAMTILNSTITLNVAAQLGRGINANRIGSPTPTNLTMYNTIVGQADTNVTDISGLYVSQGSNNLIRTHDLSLGFTGTITSDPILFPLQNNGGPTFTHMPAISSPAIDAGSDASAGTLPTDQRHLPRKVGVHVDIGAVEVGVPPVVTSSAAILAANATSIVINGFGFDPTPGNNRVAFNNGAVGSVMTASATSLTVSFSTKPSIGSLTAVVTSDGLNNGLPVQVATVILTASVNNNILTIQGDNSDHTVIMQIDGNLPTQTQILDAGIVIQTVPNSSFTSVVVQLGNGTDSFTINSDNGNPIPSGGLTDTGGTGSNTLIGPNTTNTWVVMAANAGTLNTMTSFTNIANLIGGTGADVFAFNPAAIISGSVDGGLGTGINTLDYSNFGTRAVVSLANSAATAVHGLSSGFLADIQAAIGNTATGNIVGSSGNLLVGPNATTTWNVIANNAGTFTLNSGTFTFSNFPNLTGGSGADTFKMIGNVTVANSVDGGGGTNILDYSGYSNRVIVDLSAYAASGIKQLSGSGIADFQRIIGSPSTTNILVAADSSNTWNVTGANAGTLSPTAFGTLAFSTFAYLTGGKGTDNFLFKAGASVSGAIDGRITGGANTLDYSAYSARVVINLASSAATGVHNASGSSVFDFQTIIGSTSNNIAGSTGNLLVGPSTATTWHITANNAGTLGTTPINFTAFPNLTGSTGNDNFIISNGVSLHGSLDGGTGINTLDYSAWTTAITVNLATSNATGMVKAFDIQNVIGGSANDTITGGTSGGILVGNGGTDTIIGGTGRSILIGGTGNDIVTGGSNGDILIQGTTSYDNNLAALLAILTEWQSTATLINRVAALRAGTGLAAGNKLIWGSTVIDDGGSNSLTGYTGSPTANEFDWFFANQAIGHDTLHATQTGDITN